MLHSGRLAALERHSNIRLFTRCVHRPPGGAEPPTTAGRVSTSHAFISAFPHPRMGGTPLGAYCRSGQLSLETGRSVPHMTISLREITEDNIDERSRALSHNCRTRSASSPQSVDSLAEAAEVPQANPWFRAVYADGQPVRFVILAWNIDPQPPGIIGPWFLWKLLIDHRHQRLGYGHVVMRQIVKLIRGQGAAELLTSYALGDGGPEGFYAALGFVPTGTVDDDGEVLASLSLGG